MGAEQSVESKRRADENYERMIKQALEQQRKTYEEKCKELLREQLKTKAPTMSLNEQNVIQNKTSVIETQGNNAPLYPSLPQLPTINILPSTSSASSSSTIKPYRSILHPLQDQPSSQYNYAVQSNLPQNDTVVQNMSHSVMPSDCQPSAPPAPTAPETSSTSKQKQSRPHPKVKKDNVTYKCPSCKNNYTGINIFQCERGHSSCNQCKVNGVQCGICKSRLTNMRNIELERIIADLQKINVKNTERVNCPNKSDGCSLSFKPENLQTHLKECIFREMECPLASVKYRDCFWRGKINQIQGHFLECHPDQTGVNVDTEICFDRLVDHYVVHHVALGNFNFLIHVKLDTNLQTFFMSVQLIGSLVSASKWSYEFHVYDQSEPRRKFMYVDNCLPTSILFSDISKETKCASLPLLYALSFFKDNKVTYKFYIKRDETKWGAKQRGGNRPRSVQ